MSRNTYAEAMAEWRLLLAGFDMNATDFPHLAAEHAELHALVVTLAEINHRQDVARATQSQATRDLETGFARALQLSSQMRNGVRSRYGVKSERLTEFGISPFRRRLPAPLTPGELAASAAQKAEAAARAAARAATRAARSAEDVLAEPTVQPPKS